MYVCIVIYIYIYIYIQKNHCDDNQGDGTLFS